MSINPEPEPLFRLPVPWNAFVHEGGRWHPNRYRQYCESPEWDIVEAFLFQFYDFECQDCGEEAEVMHHTAEGYDHLGKELPGAHVVPLCYHCHAVRHGKIEMWDQVDAIKDEAA